MIFIYSATKNLLFNLENTEEMYTEQSSNNSAFIKIFYTSKNYNYIYFDSKEEADKALFYIKTQLATNIPTQGVAFVIDIDNYNKIETNE